MKKTDQRRQQYLELPLLVLLTPEELLVIKCLRVMNPEFAELYVDFALEGARYWLETGPSATEVIPLTPKHRTARK